MNSPVHILHLSDFHYATKHASKQKQLINALCADLRRVIAQYGRPDVVIFSGDIVNNPDDDDIFYRFIDITNEIAIICGVQSDSIIFLPGNHEVSWAYLKNNVSEEDKFREIAKVQSAVEDAYNSGELDQYVRAKMSAFFDFCDVSSPWSSSIFCVSNIDSIGVSLVALNSAAFSGSKGSLEERGKLAVPEGALEAALEQCSYATRIFVSHHGADNFTEESARILQKFCEAHFALQFWGHVHDPRPTYELSGSAALTKAQSGALFDAHNRFKGYAFISFASDLSHKRIVYRTFFENRNIFDVGTNVCDGGVIVFPDRKTDYWNFEDNIYTTEDYRSWLQNSFREPVRLHGTGLNGKPLEETFVFPVLRRDVTKSSDSNDLTIDRKEVWSVEKILSATENIYINVPSEFGATSLLLSIGGLAARDSSNSRGEVPLYIDFRAIKPYAAAVEAALKHAYPEVSDGRYALTRVPTDRRLLLLIDNYYLESAEAAAKIELLKKMAPRGRFIVAYRSPLGSYGNMTVTADSTISGITLTMALFNRNQVRKIVKNYQVANSDDESSLVEEIFERFSALNIPITGYHIARYLFVVSRERRYSPLNAANIFESFVEALLEKPAKEGMLRSSIDYREKVDLLSLFAASMCKNSDSYKLTTEEIYALANGHYKEIGLKRDAMQIIREFVDYGILETVGTDIYFKYAALHSYFVAHRMREYAEFFEYIMSEDRYLKYTSEIDIFCGLSRNRTDIISRIEATYDEISAKLIGASEGLLNESEVAKLRLPGKATPEALASLLKEETAKPHGTADADSKVFDHGVSRDEFKQRFQRPDAQDEVVKWFLSLRAYTVALKNLEGIPHATKMRHLEKIVSGWASIAVFFINLIPLLFEGGNLQFAGRKIQFVNTAKIAGEFIRALMIHVPVLVSSLMRADLGTLKLELQLKDLECLDKPVSDFLRIGLLADMKADAFIKMISRFFKTYSGSPFLIESSIRKILDMYYRYGLKKAEMDEIEKIIADTCSKHYGTDGERERSTMITRLKTQRLISRLDS